MELIGQKIETKIRTLDFEGVKIGTDSALSFMRENNNCTKPSLALEIPYIIDKNYPQVLKNIFTGTFEQNIIQAQKNEADFLAIKFNLSENDDINKAVSALEAILPKIQKPLIIAGANNRNLDKILLPSLVKVLKKPSVIAFGEETTYKEILPCVIENKHVFVLKSPIDINLAKELNILSTDAGLSPDKILMDSDMGGLGYGFDYGYSMVERLKQAGFEGDLMLNMPIILFVGDEVFKAKELKSDTFDKNWGDIEKRALHWEICACIAMISAGANILVCAHPESIKYLKAVL